MLIQPIVPTPTPTPLTLSSGTVDKIVDASAQAFQSAQDKQAFIVFLYFIVGLVIIGIILSLAYLFRQISRRNTPPKEDTNAKAIASALATFGQLAERAEQERTKERTETIARDEARHKDAMEERERWRVTLEKIDQRHAEQMKGLSDGFFKLAEESGKNTPILDQLKIDVHTMSTKGSEPVQEMARTLEQIAKHLSEIKDNYLTKAEAKTVINEAILKVVNQAGKNLELVDAAMRVGIQEEQKRRTDSQPIPAITPTSAGA